MENYEGILDRGSCLHFINSPAEPSLIPRLIEEVVVQLRCDLGRPWWKYWQREQETVREVFRKQDLQKNTYWGS